MSSFTLRYNAAYRRKTEHPKGYSVFCFARLMLVPAKLPLMWEERFASIESKLNQMQAMMPPERGRILNSDYSHCFPLNPRASLEQIAAFEDKYQCSLPEDYREFIQRLGDGGMGQQGINALFRVNNKTENYYKVALLAPFPFKWEEHEAETGEIHLGFFRYWDSLEPVEKNCDLAIKVYCEGCDWYLFLILSGEEKGTIWRALTESGGYSAPIQFGGQLRVSFLEWFERWLDGTYQTAVKAFEQGIPVSPY